MAETLEKIRGQLTEFFNKYDKKQKIKMGLAGVFILVALTGLIFYFTRVDYVVLYNNLEPKQAGEVLNILAANNIQAKIGDNSGIILVPEKDEKQAQIVVATQGLPAAKFSYEDAFSGNSFMMTSEERAQKYLYAQMNYLASTIEVIPGVRSAVVHLTVPEKTGFIGGNSNSVAKAAVFLEMEENKVLDADSIRGITVLVSNAVQGLSPENVTIHGSDGRILNDTESENEMFQATDQLALSETVKKNLEKSIVDFLSTVYGYGNVVVMANVRLDFDSEVTEIQEFSPPIEGETTGIIRSMQELQQNVVNDGTGGVPGTDTNTDDPTQYVEYDQNLSRYNEANRTINYEINELRKQIIKAQGQVKDVTVAVYINSRAITNGELSAEEKKELQNIIAAAAGLDTKVVEVGVRAFSDSLEDQLRAALENAGTEATGLSVSPWLLGVFAVAVLGAAYFIYTKTKKREVVEPVKEIIPPAPVEELDLELSGSQVKQQIEKLVAKKPDAVAQLLRNWLSED